LEGRLCDHPDQPGFKASVQLRVLEPSENPASLLDVFAVEANRRVIGVPAEEIRLELVQRLGECLVRSVRIKPDAEQPQVSVVVVFDEVERVVSGFVDVEPVDPFSWRGQCLLP
jgi:hypothetical protein